MTQSVIQANVDVALLSRIPEMFDVSLPTTLHEIVQNSRRAGATKVEFAVTAVDGGVGVSATDNGKGLADPSVILSAGTSGWSGFDQESPAGLGALSPFGIAEGKVTYASNDWMFHITREQFTNREPVEVLRVDRAEGFFVCFKVPKLDIGNGVRVVREALQYVPETIGLTVNGEEVERKAKVSDFHYVGDVCDGVKFAVGGKFASRHAPCDVLFFGRPAGLPYNVLDELIETIYGSSRERPDFGFIVDGPVALDFRLPDRDRVIDNDALAALVPAMELAFIRYVASGKAPAYMVNEMRKVGYDYACARLAQSDVPGDGDIVMPVPRPLIQEALVTGDGEGLHGEAGIRLGMARDFDGDPREKVDVVGLLGNNDAYMLAGFLEDANGDLPFLPATINGRRDIHHFWEFDENTNYRAVSDWTVVARINDADYLIGHSGDFCGYRDMELAEPANVIDKASKITLRVVTSDGGGDIRVFEIDLPYAVIWTNDEYFSSHLWDCDIRGALVVDADGEAELPHTYKFTERAAGTLYWYDSSGEGDTFESQSAYFANSAEEIFERFIVGWENASIEKLKTGLHNSFNDTGCRQLFCGDDGEDVRGAICFAVSSGDKVRVAETSLLFLSDKETRTLQAALSDPDRRVKLLEAIAA